MNTEPGSSPLDPQVNRILGPNPANANLIYILYFLSLLVGITLFVGLIIAYLNRGKAPEWLQSHYTLQIRTFWIGLLYFAICLITTPLIIGLVLFVAVFAWFTIRMLKGMQALGQNEPVKKPQTWLF